MTNTNSTKTIRKTITDGTWRKNKIAVILTPIISDYYDETRGHQAHRGRDE